MRAVRLRTHNLLTTFVMIACLVVFNTEVVRGNFIPWNYSFTSLEEFIYSEEYAPFNKTLHQVRGTYLSFKNNSWKNNPEDIRNLNEYLTPFAASKCHILISNFPEIYLFAHMEHPVILRKSIPVVVGFTSVGSDFMRHDIAWVLERYNMKNETVLEKDNPSKCSFSRFFMGLTINSYHDDICIRLNLVEYSKHTKPWNCAVKVDIFPPVYDGYIMTKPYFGIFAYQTYRYKHMGLSLPSSIPLLDILITYANTDLNLDELKKEWWLYIISDYLRRPSNMANNIFLTLGVSQTGIAGNLTLLKFCSHCSENKHFLELRLEQSVTHNFKQLSLLTFPGSHKMINVILSTPILHRGGDKVVANMFALLDRCDIYGEAGVTATQQVAKAYAQIWLWVVPNQTLLGKPGENCINGRKSEISFLNGITIHFLSGRYRNSLLYNFPAFIHDKLTQLRFVSHGSRRMSGYQFHELTGIFDHWVWICILGSVVTISSSLKVLGNLTHTKFFTLVMSPLKVLLEQGDPFEEIIENARTARLRLLLGVLLCTGIVLSSAYKNKNVYNMISPLKSVPYQWFHELVQDGFTVYTRAIRLDFYYFINSMSKENLFTGATETVKVGEVYALAISEVTQELLDINSAADSRLTFKDIKENRLKEDLLVSTGISEQSKIHPFIHQLINETLDGMPQDTLYGPFKQHDFYVDRKNIIRDKEDRFLYHVLKSCKRCALILPKYMCQVYTNKLMGEGISEAEISIGKETYSEIYDIIGLEGPVPPFILRRIQAIGISGIWEWWMRLGMEFSRHSTSDVICSAPTKPPNMGGNILVIFIVWSIGELIAVVIFFLESWRFVFVVVSKRNFHA